jgi:NitT/TauT family transport system ATP-binding protein
LLTVTDLAKTYGAGAHATQAIARVGFSVEESEFVSVVGPSGCGKTTLLKCMSGLMPPTAGRTTLRGSVITEPPPELAIVFQDYSRSLFPWLTVHRNVLLPLRHKRDLPDKPRAVDESLAAVGLTKFADHYPWQLSGGMQQRVAIARALAYQPKVLLMDEPFASVDAQTRAELEDLVLRVRVEFGVTVVLVTHDIDEAVYMADRVIVLTRSPTTVLEILDVDLPRPRDQVSTKELPGFAHLRARVYRSIMDRTGVEHDTPQQLVSG